jgi:hypothetical protein
MRFILLIPAAAALASAGAAASASGSLAEDGSRCTVAGFVAADGPAELRSGPGRTFPVSGVIPTRDPDAEMDRPAHFDAVEARDGWFRVENAAPWSAEEAVQGVSGWLDGREVGFSLQTHIGLAEPDPASEIRWRSRTMEEPETVAALDCRGEWVKLLFRDAGETREGWFRGVCGNPDTSCDMPPGDDYRE